MIMSIKHVPSSNVPIHGHTPASIKQYKEGIIQHEHHAVEEDAADPERDIGVESELDILDDALRDQLEVWRNELNQDEPGLEAFDKVQAFSRQVGYQVSRLFDDNETRAIRIASEAQAILESLHKYTPPTESKPLRTAKRVHVNQSIAVKDIETALNNNIRLADFIKKRYKVMIKNYVDRIINETASFFRGSTLERLSSMSTYRQAVAEISENISTDVSNHLSSYFIGPSDERLLVGGYRMERMKNWKQILIDIGSFLRFRSWPNLNLARIIRITHNKYTGDGVLKRPPSRQDIQKLAGMAKQLAELCIVRMDDVSFSISEYKHVLNEITGLSKRYAADTSWADDFSDWARAIGGRSAVKTQVAAAAALPARIIQRNLETADAVVAFCHELMGESAPEFERL